MFEFRERWDQGVSASTLFWNRLLVHITLVLRDMVTPLMDDKADA